jgi:hypothetical protein
VSRTPARLPLSMAASRKRLTQVDKDRSGPVPPGRTGENRERDRRGRISLVSCCKELSVVHNPFLKEQSMQIAREYLRRSGEIANDAAADWLL